MLLQVISVVGALMVLSTYGLLQGGVWRELNAGYLAFNIVGSLLLGIVAIVSDHERPSDRFVYEWPVAGNCHRKLRQSDGLSHA